MEIVGGTQALGGDVLCLYLPSIGGRSVIPVCRIVVHGRANPIAVGNVRSKNQLMRAGVRLDNLIDRLSEWIASAMRAARAGCRWRVRGRQRRTAAEWLLALGQRAGQDTPVGADHGNLVLRRAAPNATAGADVFALARRTTMVEHPKASWFRIQALNCLELALRARDVRIKRLFTVEAERWLRLAKLKQDAVLTYDQNSQEKVPPKPK
jgi:hypothetical protein